MHGRGAGGGVGDRMSRLALAVAELVRQRAIDLIAQVEEVAAAVSERATSSSARRGGG
jgi:hypothetical protein